MALSEKLYTLRRRSGLSQEQLAERLNVSRQAISKWESGQSVPESDKLIVISDFFGVSLDYLLKENVDCPATDTPRQENGKKWLGGLICCIGGVLSLMIWGILSILNPDASDRLAGSSMIHIDGNGIFLILCVAAIVVGAILLLKNAGKK